jgi:hypothetical protein
MRTSTLILSIATATFAATTGWLAWELHQRDAEDLARIAAPDVRMDGAGLKRAIPVLVAASNKLAKSLALVPNSPTATRGSAKRSTSAAGRCSTRPTPS